MSPVVIKGLIGTGFLGIGGVGIWQTIELFTPRNIRQRLELDGESFYSFVEGEAIDGWKKLAKEYKSANGNELSEVNISGTDPNETEAKSFQAACKKLADKPLEGEYKSDLDKVKKWCIIKSEGSQGATSN